jgi:hypothetical protein
VETTNYAGLSCADLEFRLDECQTWPSDSDSDSIRLRLRLRLIYLKSIKLFDGTVLGGTWYGGIPSGWRHSVFEELLVGCALASQIAGL